MLNLIEHACFDDCIYEFRSQMLLMFIFIENTCWNSHVLIEILIFFIEICGYYDDEIKDLIFWEMYVEYKVSFDWKTRQNKR